MIPAAIILLVSLLIFLGLQRVSDHTLNRVGVTIGIAGALAAILVFIFPAASPQTDIQVTKVSTSPTINLESAIGVSEVNASSTPISSIVTISPSTIPENTVSPLSNTPTSLSTKNELPLSLELNQVQVGNIDGVELILRTIEILPDNTMRWDLSYWNKSSANILITIDYKQTSLADEFGNLYEVSGDIANTEPKDMFNLEIQSGIRRDHSIFFPAPRNGAKVFLINLVNPCCTAVYFAPFSIRLNTNFATMPTSIPTSSSPDSIMYQIDQVVNANIPDVELIVRSVEVLPDQSMRWNISFWNKSKAPILVAIEYNNSYLADETGSPYEIYGDSKNTGPKDTFQATVKPGIRFEHAIFFPAPRNNAKTFLVRLNNPCCTAVNFAQFTTVLRK